jgi:uncharacterized protein (TIGR02145 family)
MKRKNRLSILFTFIVLALIFTDCTKDDKYRYFDDYEGNWQFRVYRRTWGNLNRFNQFDTLYYFGSINKLSDNRGLQINYNKNTSAFVWVENDTIIYEIGKLGTIKDDEIQFGYTLGTLSNGTSDLIYGVKKVTSASLNEPPTAVTSPATGVIMTGSTLRGIVNAGSFPVDIEFEYGTSESYGKTVEALPGSAGCDIDINAKAYISGLNSSTHYHFRIKVISSAGTFYGDDMIFTTTGYSEPVTDSEGNIYKTIQIGKQLWMAENLKSTKYNNGEPIQYIQNNSSVNALTTGAYCYYDNNAAGYKDNYGALYNYFAVADSRNICPSGWHVPASSEWSYLLTCLYPNSAGRLKESGLSHWIDPNTGADNSSGFTALPGGGWGSGKFTGINTYGLLWSTTLSYDNAGFLRISSGYDIAWLDYGSKGQFISVRCLKE